jgi:hypothetical protein
MATPHRVSGSGARAASTSGLICNQRMSNLRFQISNFKSPNRRIALLKLKPSSRIMRLSGSSDGADLHLRYRRRPAADQGVDLN